MANIMINKICNLQCPYCFANKFVNKDTCKDENNISLENFERALDFVTFNNSDDCRLGIIGGEPTLHPQFEELVKKALNRAGRKEVLLFTNGICLDKYIDIFNDSRIGVLINLNSPEDIGEEKYKRIEKALLEINKKEGNKGKISLGVNLYDEKKDYSYAIEMCKKIDTKNLRVSVVVPNTEDKRNSCAEEYFLRMKPMVLKFFKECRKNNIIVHYDCNIMPKCVLNDDEYAWMQSYVKEFIGTINYPSNLLDFPSCEPVIDVLPDLTAVRCFGCSDLKVKIADFYDINHLSSFFENKIDCFSNNLSMNPKCRECYDRHIGRCNGGCIAFKKEKLEKLRDISIILDR